MDNKTIAYIMERYVEKKYPVQRVVSAALCLLADTLEEEGSKERERILELYGTELLTCVDELTPY